MNDSNFSRVPSFELRRPIQGIRLTFLALSSLIVLSFVTPILPWWLVSIWAVVNFGAWIWEYLTSPSRRRDPHLQPIPREGLKHRHRIRGQIFLAVLCLNLFLLLALSFVTHDHNDLIILLVTGYSLLTFAWLAYEAIRWSNYGQNRWLWFSLSTLFGLLVFSGMYQFSGEFTLSVGIAILYGVVAVIIYFMQRLGVEDRVQIDVLRNLIVEFLGMPHTRTEWTAIVQQIEKRLRFNRVFILEPNMDRSALLVVAEAGDYPSVLGKVMPLEQGITGKVFQNGAPEGWNDIEKCPEYSRLVDGSLDDTKAEIAVPIQHLGITYGILDVQDDHPNVFRWDDIYTLEVIARILGVAISAEKTDLLVQEAYDLWEELSSHSYSEETMFQEFAQFAEEKLGADVVIYYPLSPTGYPINRPLYRGYLFHPERMQQGIQDPRSPLVQLIRDWKPNFADRVYPDSVFARWLKTDPPSFTIREKIESVCFVPVGTRKEYLGAMFLNYRKPRSFDGLFRFMVLSFSQTFAILASRERYKSILFEGFGRPELGVHNLFSRYGLKTGVREEGEKIFQSTCNLQPPGDFNECGMSPLLQRVDDFLRAVSLAQSSIPPMFLSESLTDELANFISTLPIGKNGRRPAVQLDINPRIEREAAWSKLALYRLITEAMNNAVFHGETNEIKIDAKRKNAELSVQILNNGNPLPQDSDVKRSRRGIYALLNDFELKFGASTSINRGPDNTGTCVEAAFPALPLKDEA